MLLSDREVNDINGMPRPIRESDIYPLSTDEAIVEQFEPDPQEQAEIAAQWARQDELDRKNGVIR